MKKKRRSIIYKLVLGGALIGSAFFISSNLTQSYDSVNTHPALTSEVVKFYNLNFPGKALSENDRNWLIKGATDEDTPPRWLNHFYDPVHQEGWLGYTTSKEWALSSGKQQALANISSGGINALKKYLDNGAYADYSYERALADYATGNRKRAMIAVGHVMHLLEDSNVPEHTRGDTHLPLQGTESPYEKEMAKWTPYDIQIAQKIFDNGKKAILLSSLNEYFDRLANYSNNYFFSEDTINNDKFKTPNLKTIKKIIVNGRERLFAIGVDQNRQEYKLALIHAKVTRNFFEIKDITLMNPEIGPLILDGYWERLSANFIPHGAGALKLFMDQAETLKKQYASEKSGEVDLTSKFFAFLGFPRNSYPQAQANLLEALARTPTPPMMTWCHLTLWMMSKQFCHHPRCPCHHPPPPCHPCRLYHPRQRLYQLAE